MKGLFQLIVYNIRLTPNVQEEIGTRAEFFRDKNMLRPARAYAGIGAARLCAADERAEVFRVQIPWELILCFAIGLSLLCLIGYLLLVPMRFMWRLLAGGVMGALALLLVNLIGSLVGFGVEINPFTAMAVGFLGLPGAALVVALQLLL